MQRFIITVLGLFFIVATLIATPNLLIDGVESAVIEPPCEFEITADFSVPGGTLVFRLYFDNNGNRVPESIEMIQYFKLIDGVPPIGWVDDNHIPGDFDSTANGEMTNISFMDEMVPLGDMVIDTLYFYLIAIDESDGTADTAIMKTLPTVEDIDPIPPYIYGTLYSALDSAEVVEPAFCLIPELDEVVVLVDTNGRYVMEVPDRDSAYTVRAIPLDGDHITTMMPVTFGAADDSVQLDLVCNALPQHIYGTITLDGATPVPGFLIIFSMNMTTYSISAAIHDQTTGEYMLPVEPGSTNVSFLDYENIPTGYFPFPMSYTVYVPPTGDVSDIDFDLQPLDAAISGTVIDSSLHGDAENEGLWIYADGGDFGDFVARTDEDGNFIIPVKGTTEGTYHITIDTYGYDVYPWEYDDILVDVGDTVEGYNFVLGEAWITNSISGAVVDIDDTPVEDAIVIIRNEELPFKKAWQAVYTDSMGEYEFTKLPPWEGVWFLGTYKDSLGLQTPPMITILELPDDTVVTDADFAFSLSGIEKTMPALMRGFELEEVFPNPFNATARIKLTVFKNSPGVRVSLFDILGRKRRVIHDGPLSSGTHELEIDGRGLSSGIYFVKARSDAISQTREVLLIK